MKRTIKNKKGFTLIELIVVIAILGVLALILIPQFMGYVDDADRQAQRSNTREVYDATMTSIAKTKSLKRNQRTDINLSKFIYETLGASFNGRYEVTIKDGSSSVVIRNVLDGSGIGVLDNPQIISVSFDNCVYTVSTNTYSGTCA